MNTSGSVAIATHRKLIDIPDDVFQGLSIRAAAAGTNLKRFIENILIREYEDFDDAEVYNYLVSTRPEGQIMLDAREQDEFERRYGLGKYK